MPFSFVIVFILLIVSGCSTSEVYRPVSAKADPTVSGFDQTALLQSEGIQIEAQLAREDNGRLRIDMVVDNRGSFPIDLSLGDVRLYCNGQDLKVYSTRFLRNWSYKSATRGSFAPSESAYASVAYESPGSLSGGEKMEVSIEGISDARTGRQVIFPKVGFGEPAKEKRTYPAGKS